MAVPLRISVETPIGPIWVEEADGAIVQTGWGKVNMPAETDVLRQASCELDQYFSGGLQRFTVPLRHGRDGGAGRVLDALRDIPFGETMEYGDLSRALGMPAQAVGQACGANRIPILIPCHRVLSASGLGGFSAPGGVETKVWLLRHEGAAGLLI